MKGRIEKMILRFLFFFFDSEVSSTKAQGVVILLSEMRNTRVISSSYMLSLSYPWDIQMKMSSPRWCGSAD